MIVQSSMDKVEVVDLAVEQLGGPAVTRGELDQGLARYARLKLDPQGSTPLNMVLSAHLLLRTAE